ncbi:MAG: hypothetical protein COB16_13090 [Rhodobacteraceae bacterium]|nr:MAG: hypothetical protein COB16_13090 [Paracoccaceae bacterium]
MTFDLERYREHLAPLNLTTEQEDELLHDLWTITEALVDETITSPTYPLKLAIACKAFDSLEEAIAVESKSITKEEEDL